MTTLCICLEDDVCCRPGSNRPPTEVHFIPYCDATGGMLLSYDSKRTVTKRWVHRAVLITDKSVGGSVGKVRKTLVNSLFLRGSYYMERGMAGNPKL